MGVGFSLVISLVAVRYHNLRRPLAKFLIKLLIFGTITTYMFGQKVVPTGAAVPQGTTFERTFASALQVIWWLAAAWLAVGFLRAFVVLGRKPSESKLAQDLLAALVYLIAVFAIVSRVFDVPLTGLLATSGAVAIVLGLALQSSLADVFSGIVLNLEHPYHVGDWIALDDGVQGTVIETNWRSTHILTANQDLAVIPNSVVAKAKLINCSSPTPQHGVTSRVRLEASISPTAGCRLLEEIMLGATHLVRSPEPSVAIKEVTSDMIDFELTYTVSSIEAVDVAQSEVFDRIHRALAASGHRFAARLGAGTYAPPIERAPKDPQLLILGISLFSSLTVEERSTLIAKIQRKEYRPGDVVVRSGTVVEALSIVSDGVLVATEEINGHKIERLRLTPGIYFGETGLLAGQPINGEITALTKAVVYEFSRDALCPLIKARPSMAEELSEILAYRQTARLTVLDQFRVEELHRPGFATRIADRIRTIFELG